MTPEVSHSEEVKPIEDKTSVQLESELPALGSMLLGPGGNGIVEMTVVERVPTDPVLADKPVMVTFVDAEGVTQRKPVSVDAFKPAVQEAMRQLKDKQGMGDVAVEEIQVNLPRRTSTDAVPGYQPLVQEATETAPPLPSTVDENARMVDIQTIKNVQ